jgi:hypothetical protein
MHTNIDGSGLSKAEKQRMIEHWSPTLTKGHAKHFKKPQATFRSSMTIPYP